MIARYFDNCEIIEMHHDGKKDAPSGTSLATAEGISENNAFNQKRLKDGENENIEGSRGGFAGRSSYSQYKASRTCCPPECYFWSQGPDSFYKA